MKDNKNAVRPTGTDSAKVIKVIETKSSRGTGTDADLSRQVTQYWSLNGELLAEHDPCVDDIEIQADGGNAPHITADGIQADV